ncbi:hypothetical protein [Halothiobacillus sp.]|uniref:hypothetical protein n=1 Tax=Halothiobacillus sp. TaxID=1891311 RepID=UPI00260F70DA|nr:hypothetical protein [Halothiobacillus sp.]
MKSSAFGPGPMGMDFFTVDEAAERMSNLLGKKITPQNLMDYGVQDNSDLVFSVYINNWFLFRKTKGIITRESLDGLVDLHPWTVKELRSGKPVEVTWVRACKGADICAVSKYHWGHDPESWQAVFNIFPGNGEPTFPWISPSDLRIRASELEQLELLFKPTSSQVNTNENPIPHEAPVQYFHEQPVNSDLVDEPAKTAFIKSELRSESSDSISGDLAREKAEQNLRREDEWKLHARKIAEEIDPGHETQKIYVLAQEIHERLKKDLRIKNRNNQSPSAKSIERDILRGWKSKK